jgi:4-carboxymuconolactone decarboxylase
MARVPYVTRESMTPEGQQVWDEIKRSRGDVAGNIRAFLNSPQAAAKLSDLGRYAAWDTPLDRRVKVLAFLTTAREADAHYVWTVNQSVARDAGLSEEVISAIHERRAPMGLEPKDACVVQFVLELLRHHRISDLTFEALRSQVGDAGIIDVLLVVGYYHTLSHFVQALDLDLPEGIPSALTYQ